MSNNLEFRLGPQFSRKTLIIVLKVMIILASFIRFCTSNEHNNTLMDDVIASLCVRQFIHLCLIRLQKRRQQQFLSSLSYGQIISTKLTKKITCILLTLVLASNVFTFMKPHPYDVLDLLIASQPVTTCSKLTIETLE